VPTPLTARFLKTLPCTVRQRLALKEEGEEEEREAQTITQTASAPEDADANAAGTALKTTACENVLCAQVFARPGGRKELAVGFSNGDVVLVDATNFKEMDRVNVGAPVSTILFTRMRYINPETGAMKKTWQMITGTATGRLRMWSRDAKPKPPPPEGEDPAAAEGEDAPAEEKENEGEEGEEPPPEEAWHLWSDLNAEPRPGAFGPDGYGPRVNALASFEASWEDWKPESDAGAVGAELDLEEKDTEVEEDGEEAVETPEGELPTPPRPEPFTVLVVADASGRITLYDTHTWDVLPCPQMRHAESMSALMIMPRLPPPTAEGDVAPAPLPLFARRCRLVTASTDRKLCVWRQPKRGRAPPCVQLGSQSAAVMSLAPWRSAFASGQGDGSVTLWSCSVNAIGDDQYDLMYRLHANSPLRSLMVGGEGDTKVTAGDANGGISVWKQFDEEAGERLSSLPWKLMREFSAFPQAKSAAVVNLVPCGAQFLAVGDGVQVWR